jgi:hypothetical protein
MRFNAYSDFISYLQDLRGAVAAKNGKSERCDLIVFCSRIR